MCHLVLLMPVIVLPIFWLMPPAYAVPIYAVIAFLSGLVYWLITRAMRKPVATGAESMIGTRAEVISASNLQGYSKYLVRAGGEIWTASSVDSLQPGELVTVAAVDGIKLVIEPTGNNSAKTDKTRVEAR